jgi:hypothetical protein
MAASARIDPVAPLGFQNLLAWGDTADAAVARGARLRCEGMALGCRWDALNRKVDAVLVKARCAQERDERDEIALRVRVEVNGPPGRDGRGMKRR